MLTAVVENRYSDKLLADGDGAAAKEADYILSL